jgi:uncharacterized protein YcbK (DUF882 family)
MEKKFVIKYEEINPNGYTLTDEQNANIQILLDKMNKVRTVYALPMIVTSGFRSLEDHERIYKQINEKREKEGKSPVVVPMNSKHLNGEAVDIYDPDSKLYEWCKNNDKLFEDVGLWMEERQGNWQHFQIIPPASGARWFIP